MNVLDDGIYTLAYFHKDITSCKEIQKDFDKKDCDKKEEIEKNCNKKD